MGDEEIFSKHVNVSMIYKFLSVGFQVEYTRNYVSD